MKKSILIFVVVLFCAPYSVDSVIMFAQKVDKISVKDGKIYLKTGKKIIEYDLPAEGGIVDDRGGMTVFIKKDGEKCYPYYLVSAEIFVYLENWIRFYLSEASPGFCAEAEKIKNKIKKA